MPFLFYVIGATLQTFCGRQSYRANCQVRSEATEGLDDTFGRPLAKGVLAVLRPLRQIGASFLKRSFVLRCLKGIRNMIRRCTGQGRSLCEGRM
ncbi:hypothetical protein Trydic_g20216 [Trypoxylus dichotomus]